MLSSPSVRQAAARVAAALKRRYIPDGALEAEVLLRHVLHYDRAQFYASLDEPVSEESLAVIEALTERRAAGEPLAYITGHREFYGLDFIVNPDVLIPRQETELLVEIALELARELPSESVTVADIGTGSGAIAIALAASLPRAQVYATDLSADALAVAERNRRRHGLLDRVTLLQGDMLAPLPRSIDLIVSNPPYIATNYISGLQTEVQQEPLLALDGGGAGMELIRRLLEQAPPKLNAGGCMAFEISPEQADAVRKSARERFPRAEITLRNDLLGLPRCVVIWTTQ